ncbi:MAG: DUF4827 domain-containing protein [Bacteroides sp.]|nr:DUF4827 domain-containing protein [Bacteroides sp.]
MKKLSIFFLLVLGLGWMFQACNNDKTYAEMKEEERDAIKRFIELEGIKVISEKEFEAQDSLTNVADNEFVLFSESGVYMQVVSRGNGELLADGRHEILARYIEEEILDDGKTDTLSFNTMSNLYAHPDAFILTKSGNNFSATFTYGGAMYSAHNTTYVPSGWMIPFNYIKVGREISGRSKIRLIVPHSEGTSTASSQVMPCYYEITYQLSR